MTKPMQLKNKQVTNHTPDREEAYSKIEEILEKLVNGYDKSLNFQYQADDSINEILQLLKDRDSKWRERIVGKLKKKVYAYDENEDSGVIDWKDVRKLLTKPNLLSGKDINVPTKPTK